MKKIYTFCLLLFGFLSNVKADHITGGEMYYTFVGAANGQYQYSVTFKLFMVCNTFREFYDPAIISVFDKATNERVQDISVRLSRTEMLSYSETNPCITNPPTVCFRVGYYDFTVSLPASPNGYILSSQVVYRIDGMNNLVQGYNRVGATYTCEIPATVPIITAPENSSAKFTGSDLVIVCADNSFTYSFLATDEDGDILQYSFCNAYQGGSLVNDGDGGGNPASLPPYQSVPYGSGYNGAAPLGDNVHIDANTGLITGIAPSAGTYVVTVCVQEIRNGNIIATQRKDLQINIASCSIAAATLHPAYMLCGNTKTISLSNLSTSPLIYSYNWELINSQGLVIFSSTEQVVEYTFSDTGTYIIKLVINRGQECSDSTTSIARVYPGFIPDFIFDGTCFSKPTQFTDATTTVYGAVNSWLWDFGENTLDASNQQNPVYTYSGVGTKTVRLITGNTVGCIDTIIKTITVFDKPLLTLAFRDTLICIPDKLQLQASGTGNFSWSPNVDIVNANTPAPIVSPTVTTTYFVELDDDGCLNKDSVQVHVTDHVELHVMNDTIICSGDSIQLNVVSDGLHYIWTPASQILNPDTQNPIAITQITTTYGITAIIGSCSANDEIVISAVPYPTANAGDDTTICYNTSAQLHAATDGGFFTWTPQTALSDFNNLNPVAMPASSTTYVFSAYDMKGCPKPGIDTVLITVLPEMHAFAGNDTSVVINQPLQLHATGGISYAWSPPIGLSATDIADPVAVYTTPSNGILYQAVAFNEAGCTDTAFVNVKVFTTLPSVFVPTAFTPNGDGKNDLLRPIAVGMQSIEYFKVFNRWGQLVFTTRINGHGWDGSVNGMVQATGVFVWMVKATDYTGAAYFKKGTTTLIR